MSKISIITRAFNRLEYTTQCVSNVERNTSVDYEHIIVNNGSTDGTKEWLDWIQAHNVYPNIKVVHCENQGDWGGMLQAIDCLASDSTHVVQLDNDMTVPPLWLEAMLEVEQSFPANIVMLKRSGVEKILHTKEDRVLSTKVGEIGCGIIPTAVACWLAPTSTFIAEGRGHESCRSFTAACGTVVKITNMFCRPVDREGLTDEQAELLQRNKYPAADRRTRRYLKKKQKNDAKEWRERNAD